tara:strand:+ start:977 stop:1168 length:192 start_codon:yes stop_codon:yes gene_type:complete
MKVRNNNWLSFSSVGFQIIAGLLVFGWLGKKIDDFLLTYPYGFIIGLVIGGALSLYQVWRTIN